MMKTKLQPGTGTDFDELLALWESSVRHTHHFLAEEDIAFFKQLIVTHEAFATVKLVVVRDEQAQILGFAGVSGCKLEMLFVKPEAMGQGIGKLLLQHVITTHGVSLVDVNEQNTAALGFYEHAGFVVTGRSPLDGTGKPFPLLHIKWKEAPKENAR